MCHDADCIVRKTALLNAGKQKRGGAVRDGVSSGGITDRLPRGRIHTEANSIIYYPTKIIRT